MAADDLPSEFDVVILGTGLAESVVAAAFSRVGQKVLHLDRRSYYAANWASFTFNSLLTWIQQHQEEESQPEDTQDWSSLLEEGEELTYLSHSGSASIRNLQVFCFTSEEDEEEEAPPTTEEEEDKAPPTTEEEEDKAPPTTEEKETAPPTTEEDEEKAPPTTEEDEEKAPPTTEEDRAVSDDGSETTTQKPEEEEQAAETEPSQSEQRERRISYAQLLKEGRRFNIDLVSKLLYSRGSLVDLLIKSNVSRYAEFKNVTRILTYRHGNVEQVPCSRADVFASRQLSVVEKRKLMRFLTSCAEETEEQRAYNGRPYMEFLRDQQLGDNLQHFLLHSIAMVTEATPTEQGLASTRHFLRCLGRYGNTPFLFPVYGLGEIPQCFCRMSAVFGGIYCLRHSVTCMVVDKETNRCKAVIDSRGQRISCSHFVMEEGYVGAELKRQATPPRFLSRAVLITDRSVLPSDSDQQVSMVTVPPAEGCPAVKMVELCPSTMTCMPGTYLVHLTCQSVGSAHQDLSPVVTRMFTTPESPDQGPSVLWCVYFNMSDGSLLDDEDLDLPSNVYVCSGPDGALGHDHAVGQAQSIFQKVLPEEDFCPPAPNPEDIIYDGDASSSTQQEGLQEEEEENQEEVKEEEKQDLQKKEEELKELEEEQQKKKDELHELEEEQQKKEEEKQELQEEEEEKQELQEEEEEKQELQEEQCLETEE